jgi:hypothetical protein
MIKVKLSELSDSTSDQTLENQNEEELQSLHGKIKQLRSVRPYPVELRAIKYRPVL